MLFRRGLGDQKISGVNTPYVYVGSWKTMFGWHKEDLDLYSINYLHHGRPKFWYGVDINYNPVFERFAKSKFPDQAKVCPEFIRHKTTLFYPGLLVENGIKMTKTVHNEGEFIISRCSGYHAGFNFGFNIAEAVNFALSDWLQIAGKAECCKCVKDSVRFNMGRFIQNIKDSDIFYNLIKRSGGQP
jgi:hypothetical protein